MTLNRQDALMLAFEKLWESLFSSPVHLDSALSKQSKPYKSLLARLIYPILLQPASLAEVLGVGMSEEEPWELGSQNFAKWRTARQMAERIYQRMTAGELAPAPVALDFPPSMRNVWEQAWGKDVAAELIDVLGRSAPLGVRASQRLGAQALLAELENRLPVRAEASEFAPFGVRLAGYAPLFALDAYLRGDFEIQDEGSQVMALFALWPEVFAPLLRATPGRVVGKIKTLPTERQAWTVVDACAGAGGKTLALADALGGKGRIYAYDTSEAKLQALRRRATRAKLTNIQAVALDEGRESEQIQKFRNTADVVLVDAPCSGWGVLRRNPDIKWRQGADVLLRMPTIQSRLLSVYSQLVAPGGRLVFGVCTFRPEETVEIVKTFTQEHPEFQAREGGFLGPGPTDGFFMQSFVRN